MGQKEEINYDERAAEYVEAVKKCKEKPTWDLIHTAYVCGATDNADCEYGDWKSRLVAVLILYLLVKKTLLMWIQKRI